MCEIIRNCKVKDLKINTTVDIFLLIKLMNEKETSKSKKSYIDFVFRDSTGEVDGKLWETSIKELPPDIKVGELIKVRAFITEFNNKKQLKILNYRKALASDGVKKTDFIKAAPIPSEDMYAYILKIAQSISIEDMKKICVTWLERNKETLLFFPGAMVVHHAERGGLLHHIYRMLKSAEALQLIYNCNLGLLQAGVIMHDNGKLDELDSDENGVVADYTKGGKLLGHISLGLVKIALLCSELNIDKECELLLEHFIVSHHYDEEKGSFVKPAFYEAELLHELDSRDAIHYIFKEGAVSIEPGEFSAKQFYLQNRQIYIPKL